MGYDEASVVDRLAVDETLIPADVVSIAKRRLGRDRLSDLIRLFLLDEPVPAARLDLDPVDFLEPDGALVRSSIAVQPWRGCLVAHDWRERLHLEDHVVGASAFTSLLANLTVRRPAGDALDLGTGSGAQAVLASRHADRVAAVDLNPRALRLAGWTLALNRVDNVDLRLDDARHACPGELFDLVTANLPFVVSPDRRWLFRDSEGQISRAVVERTHELLVDGGYAHLLCQWSLDPDERWDEQPRAWVAGCGCDAWILRVGPPEDALDHAVHWNHSLRSSDPAAFEETVDRWLAHFARQGIESVVTGSLVLRRRDDRTWIRVDEASSWPTDGVGDEVERLFAGQTLVASAQREEALLDLRLAPVDALRLDATRSYGEHGFDLVAAQVRTGLPLRRKLSRAAVATVLRLDGKVRLGELPEAAEALPAIRELVATGLLTTV